MAARVLTLEPDTLAPSPEERLPRAVEIEDGKIRRLLHEEELAGLDADLIEDLGPVTLLPGLCDAHLHLAGLGRGLQQLDLRSAGGPEEVAALVATAASGRPAGEWIRGRGWDQHRFSPPTLPDHAVLDAACDDHPVWLARVDGHAAWLNRRALELAGIDARTPDPAGGTIVRDARGEPTGVVIDNALELAGRALPPRSPAERERDLLAGIGHCRELGLTSVHDMGMRADDLRVLRKLEEEHRLELRVVVYLDWSEALIASELELGPPAHRSSDRLSVVGVKLYADGALGSHGAAMESPYADRPDQRGLLLTEPGPLRERALRAARAGLDVAIHGIGDRGCRHALEAFEAIRAEGHGVQLRLEHAQILDARLIDRLVRARVVASVQPTHATSDMGWVEARLGTERLEAAYAWRSLLRAGAALALGSDAPIEPANPWFGVHAAVTRQDREGRPEGGWRSRESLTLGEALQGFTRGGGSAAGLPRLGTLQAGAPADLTALQEDPRTLSGIALRRVRTAGSWVGQRPRS